MKANILDIALFEAHLKENTTLSDSSIRIYKQALILFTSSNPDILDPTAYNNFIIEHSIKKRSYQYFYAIKEWLKYKFDANTRNEIFNQLIHPKMPTDVITRRRHLSDDEIMDVINNLESRSHRIVALLQSLTGARAGDVLRLEKSNIQIDDDNGEAVMLLKIKGKGNKWSIKSLFDEVAQKLLLEYIAVSNNTVGDYCFLEASDWKTKQKRSEYELVAMNYMRYWRALKQSLDISGINRKEFATHDFRRQFARKVWDKYKDVVLLQNIMEHVKPESTLRYLRSSGLQNRDIYKMIQS
jgi:integrase